MIKYTLTHPDILKALSSNGHGSKVLITDGNFPAGTMTPPNSQKVYLHLRKDLPTVTEVLETIITTVNIESAILMDAPDHAHQDIHDEFSVLLPQSTLTKLTRFDFYDAACSKDLFLVIVTGDSRRFANIILSLGCLNKYGS